MNVEEIRSKIRKVLKANKKTVNSLAKEHEAQQKTLNNQIKGDTALSASTISLILEWFPDISAEWLLRGTGEMLLSDANEAHDNRIIATLQKTIDTQDALIKSLNERIEELKRGTAPQAYAATA